MDFLIAAMWYGVLQILHIISSFMKLFFIYQYSFISKFFQQVIFLYINICVLYKTCFIFYGVISFWTL